MTEAQVQPSEVEETEDEEVLNFPDEMAELSFNTLEDLINERNAAVAKVNASKGDAQTLMENLRENSNKPAAVKAREARDKYQELLDEAILALDEAVRPEVKETIEKAGDTSEGEAEIKQFDERIKPGLTYFKKSYGEDLASHLPSLARLKNASMRATGSGGRRVRGYTVTVTADGKATDFENIASAAKYLEQDTSVLQEAFFKAAGIGAEGKLADAPDRVDFTVEYTDTYEDGSSEDKVASIFATRTEKQDSEQAA